MEASENCSVKVAVHIRPLIADERLHGCKECVTVTPGKPQVTMHFSPLERNKGLLNSVHALFLQS
jgi:hypothetical protein